MLAQGGGGGYNRASRKGGRTMKRKLLSFALVLAMVLAIFPVSAFAAESNGEFTY